MNTVVNIEHAHTLRQLNRQRLQSQSPEHRLAVAQRRALNGLCSECSRPMRKRWCCIDLDRQLMFCEACMTA